MNILIDKKTVFILCGGLGTRLRSEIGDVAKSLSQIDKKLFIDFQLDG